MSDSDSDRFDRIDGAVEKLRNEVDEAVDESKELSEKATKEVQEAIDDLENKLSNLREEE
jgi:vacuolar-type H+-ATPase subunit H